MKISRNVMLLLFVGFIAASFTSLYPEAENLHKETEKASIKWYDISDLAQLQQKEEKKVIVDIYTSWCKWCKVMDEETFNSPEVIKHLNANYYMVKLNAETKEAISFNGKTYNFQAAVTGRRGYHQLAKTLTNDQLSFPSVIVLKSSLEVDKIGRGFKKPTQFLGFLNDGEI